MLKNPRAVCAKSDKNRKLKIRVVTLEPATDGQHDAVLTALKTHPLIGTSSLFEELELELAVVTQDLAQGIATGKRLLVVEERL